MIIDIFLVCSAYLWGVVLHELGHWFYFRFVLNKKEVIISLGEIPGRGVRLRVGCPADYSHISTARLQGIFLSGIMAGMIPFILLAAYRWQYGLFIGLYLYGCGRDIQNIKRLKTWHRQKYTVQKNKNLIRPG